MITVLTVAFNKYLSVKYEDFTQKYIDALGLFQLIDNPNPDDVARLEKFEKEISDDCLISLYKLDRHINKSKGEFSTVTNKIRFCYRVGGQLKENELTEDDIQTLLCKAIREVHQIVLRNMKGYQLEQKIDSGSDDLDPLLKEILK